MVQVTRSLMIRVTNPILTPMLEILSRHEVDKVEEETADDPRFMFGKSVHSIYYLAGICQPGTGYPACPACEALGSPHNTNTTEVMEGAAAA